MEGESAIFFPKTSDLQVKNHKNEDRSAHF